MKPDIMLEEIYNQLASTYTNNKTLIHQCWSEIEQHYTSEQRHYHSLQHLHHLWNELTSIKTQVQDWDTLLFTLFYHDVVYDVLKPDNEEQSALYAVRHMELLKVPKHITDHCYHQILATKQHLLSDDNDTNLFTDADLSILGQPWDMYKMYAENVRKEYAVYPDNIYIPGRKKVLEHFLKMERIFKTTHYYQAFETQARMNLSTELQHMA